MMTMEEVGAELKSIADDLKMPDAETYVEKPDGWFHVVISSPFFEGKSSTERNNIIWRELEHRFDDDTILAITQCYLVTPEEKEEGGIVTHPIPNAAE